LLGLLGIFFVLSLSGFTQANIFNIDIYTLWILRTLFGIVVLFSLFTLIDYKINIKLTYLDKYNLAGVLNDGFGGIALIFLASYLYPLLGFTFSGIYEYVVFAFVTMTGVIHLMALIYKQHSIILTNLTIIIRVFISSLFFSLYSISLLGIEALIISLFDLLFASYYLVFIYKKDELCFKE